MTVVQLPPLQAALKASAALTAIVVDRISMTRMPEDRSRPYVVWGITSGIPANTLSCPPEWDDQVCYVDLYSEDQAECRRMMQAAVEAVEEIGHIVFGPVPMDEGDPTKLFRWTFNWEVFNDRA